MLTASRFVVIDDKREHLEKIKTAFDVIGAPCLGIVFPDYKPRSISGVRVLFVDLHLMTGGALSDPTKNYATILSLLEECIVPDSGPYLLVLWTSFPGEKDALVEYIEKRIAPENIQLKPLGVIGLDKSEFFDLSDGQDKSPSRLHEKILEHLNSIPQLGALLNWEECVGEASGRTLAALMDAVPKEKRSTPEVGEALDGLLSRLAKGAFGSHAADDKHGAINSALAPLLVDWVLNQKCHAGNAEVWEKALTQLDAGDLPPDIAGKINKMLHLSLPSAEKMTSASWGAVVPIPSGWEEKEAMLARFGVDRDAIIENEFNVDPGDKVDCKLRLVRLGAACDYAQDKVGPIPYILSLEMPDYKGSKSAKRSEWKSPVFKMNEVDSSFVIKAHAGFVVSLLPKDVEGVAPLYRIREQLLMEMMAYVGSYTTRPGIFAMHAKQLPSPHRETSKEGSKKQTCGR